jgi:hypothetical protein
VAHVRNQRALHNSTRNKQIHVTRIRGEEK